MWAEALSRFCRLLLIAVYAAATITSATSALAACLVFNLDHRSHAGHAHGAAHHEHDKHSTSQVGDCLNCCIGACFLGASLTPPASAIASSAFYGARILYSSDDIALTDRSIPPDPAPPKPTGRT